MNSQIVRFEGLAVV